MLLVDGVTSSACTPGPTCNTCCVSVGLLPVVARASLLGPFPLCQLPKKGVCGGPCGQVCSPVLVEGPSWNSSPELEEDSEKVTVCLFLSVPQVCDLLKSPCMPCFIQYTQLLLVLLIPLCCFFFSKYSYHPIVSIKPYILFPLVVIVHTTFRLEPYSPIFSGTT